MKNQDTPIYYGTVPEEPAPSYSQEDIPEDLYSLVLSQPYVAN